MRDAPTGAALRLPRFSRTFRRFAVFGLLLGLGGLLWAAPAALAQTAAPATAAAGPGINLQINGGEGADLSVAIQLVLVMTLLTLAPSIIMMMTSFTRIVIVLGFVRTALGVQGAPANQLIIGLSLFLTFFIMGPTWDRIYADAVVPYQEKRITSQQAFDSGSTHMKNFMLRQTRPKDVEFFLSISRMGPTSAADLPLRVVVPAFIMSELRTSFIMGFRIFIPFLIVEFLVASTLMAMGMMMMPPAIISLPFKILLFVLVDGWSLVVQSLVKSFNA